MGKSFGPTFIISGKVAVCVAVGRGVRVAFGVLVRVKVGLGENVVVSGFGVWVIVAWGWVGLLVVETGAAKFSPILEISNSRGSACEQELSAREKNRIRRRNVLAIVLIISSTLQRLTFPGSSDNQKLEKYNIDNRLMGYDTAIDLACQLLRMNRSIAV